MVNQGNERGWNITCIQVNVAPLLLHAQAIKVNEITRVYALYTFQSNSLFSIIYYKKT